MKKKMSSIPKTNINTRIWLVKVPKFVAEKWASNTTENEDFATMKIHDSNEIIDLTLPQAEWSRDIPKRYKLNISNQSTQNQYVFNEDVNGEIIEIVGKVCHEASCTPIIDEDYRKIMRKRNSLASSSRGAVLIDNDEGRKSMFISGNAAKVKDSFSILKRKTHATDKRERMSKDDLLNILFSLFEKHEYWNFKGLQDETLQPAAFLKEVLGDISILNKTGPYTGNYELKPEFKKREYD